MYRQNYGSGTNYFKMRNMKQYGFIILLAIGVLAIISCQKNTNFPSTPDLTFKSIFPQEVRPSDSVVITCEFKDKEGDIQDSIFFKASNNDVFGPYAVPDFPPQNNLRGNIILILQRGIDFVVPAGGGAADTLSFQLYLKDKEGHISDTVQTTPVVILGG